MSGLPVNQQNNSNISSYDPSFPSNPILNQYNKNIIIPYSTEDNPGITKQQNPSILPNSSIPNQSNNINQYYNQNINNMNNESYIPSAIPISYPVNTNVIPSNIPGNSVSIPMGATQIPPSSIPVGIPNNYINQPYSMNSYILNELPSNVYCEQMTQDTRKQLPEPKDDWEDVDNVRFYNLYGIPLFLTFADGTFIFASLSLSCDCKKNEVLG
ncbi:hypothetical protein WA158_007489 [Blastocystis sp. Blastoise]